MSRQKKRGLPGLSSIFSSFSFALFPTQKKSFIHKAAMKFQDFDNIPEVFVIVKYYKLLQYPKELLDKIINSGNIDLSVNEGYLVLKYLIRFKT